MPCTLLPAGLDIFGTLPASEDNLAAVEEVCRQVGLSCGVGVWMAGSLLSWHKRDRRVKGGALQPGAAVEEVCLQVRPGALR